MPVVLKNNASNSLAAAITSTDTGIVVRNGNLFPALAAGQYFYATITGADGSQEIVKVTARSGNGMTIVRAQEGTFALPFQLDSRFEMRITAATIADVVAPASGATGSRPTPTIVGQVFFDTTLGKPVWWKGAVWVDATGATV